MALWILPRLSGAAEDLYPSEFLLDLHLCKRKHFWNQQPCPEAQLRGNQEQRSSSLQLSLELGKRFRGNVFSLSDGQSE